MMQFCTILADTWHLISARKLFWIALVLTVAVGIVYASIGYTDEGISLFFVLDIKMDGIARGTPGAATFSFETFYLLTQLWTTFFGVILALVTCASIFPEFMGVGSIDNLLSKPISRPRLFLAKFLSGLIFAGVQVSVLAAIVFAAIRWRLGEWHWPVFWSVPLVVIFFSYLYAVCVFFGVWTRSTLAALMLTLVVWAGLKGIGMAEGFAASLSRTSAGATLGGSEHGLRWAEMAYRVIHGLRVALPKTTETVALVESSVMREKEKEHKREQDIEAAVRSAADLDRFLGKKPEPPSVVRERVAKDLGAMDTLKQSPGFILGTSLVFEALVLGLGCWIFSRRDY